MNFVCSAKARGLDISSVLLFATDQETKDLAEGLGLAAFYDETVSWDDLNLHSFLLVLFFLYSILKHKWLAPRTMAKLPPKQQGAMETMPSLK